MEKLKKNNKQHQQQQKQEVKNKGNKNQKQNNKKEEKNDAIPNSIQEKNNKFYLVIQAKPNAKTSQILAITDESIELSLAAQPVDGQANAELVQFICEILDLKKRNVCLDKGSKSRSKIIEISDSDYSNTEEIYEVLKENSHN